MLLQFQNNDPFDDYREIRYSIMNIIKRERLQSAEHRSPEARLRPLDANLYGTRMAGSRESRYPD